MPTPVPIRTLCVCTTGKGKGKSWDGGGGAAGGWVGFVLVVLADWANDKLQNDRVVTEGLSLLVRCSTRSGGRVWIGSVWIGWDDVDPDRP